jgi:hypothetical protein
MDNSDFSVGLRALMPDWASAYLDSPGGAATVAGVLIVLGIVVILIVATVVGKKRIVKEPEKPREIEMREFAVMVEKVESTAGGQHLRRAPAHHCIFFAVRLFRSNNRFPAD